MQRKNSVNDSLLWSQQVFLPGDELEEGDELTYDRSAYEMYHAVRQSAICVN